MALRDLRTSLKSLQFGNDTPGGGSSGLPYIQNGLPEDSPAGEYLAGIARDSMDWPLRGGTYSTIASTTDSIRISRFLTDLPRGYVFTSKQVQLQKSNPKIETGGFASRLNTQTYNLNANLLAQVFEQGTGIHIPRPGANVNELGPNNPQAKYEWIVSHKNTDQNRLVALYSTKIKSDGSLLSLDSAVTNLGISTDDTLLFDYEMGPDSLYGDGKTTILRTTNTTTAFEGYISKGFTQTSYNPSFEQSSPTTGINYLNSLGLTDYIKVNQIGGLVDGLYKSKIPNFASMGANISPTLNLNSTINTSNGFGNTNGDPFASSNNFSLPQFTPQKIDLSGGKENIDFIDNPFSNNKYPKNSYQQSSKDFIRPEQTPNEFKDTINQFNNTMGYSALLAAKGNDLAVFGKTEDFRSKTNDPIAKALADSVSYNTGGPNGDGFKMESRIGIGNPGARPSNTRSNFYTEYKGGQDKINMSPIYRRSIDTPVEDDDPSVRDLIKFCIEAIDNGYPDETNRMHFRAYITNFSDNIGAEWDSKKYMGRGENFYTYQGFTRDVNFTFIVAAQSVQEMEKIYQKVNYLASTLHPDYEIGTGFMRGSLHKLTIGEYFYRTTGIITSMNITVEDNYPWEIKMAQPELRNTFQTGSNALGNPLEKDDRGQMEVPQILKIQMNFKPIAQHSEKGGSLPQRGLKEPIIISEAVANNYLTRKDFDFAELGKKATAASTPASTTPTSTPPGTNTDTTTPAVTTTTNDVNTAPAVTTTTTQAPPANSWVPGDVVPGYSNVITKSTQTSQETWTVAVLKADSGYFGWQVTNPDGTTILSPSGNYTDVSAALSAGTTEAENVSGYNTPIQDAFDDEFGD
jgi:hypothetical protein